MKASKINIIKKSLKVKIDGFTEYFFDEVAKETSFIQRITNRLSGIDFFQLMSIEHFGNGVISLEGLCDILRKISPESDMSAQAMHQKINSRNGVSFFRRVFELTYKKHLASLIEKVPLKVFSFFSNVYLEDSTIILLNEHLSEHFKGLGGSSSKSSMKIDVVYELKRHILKNILISGGTVPDQRRAESFMDYIMPGDLFIRDLGYFSTKAFGKIQEKLGFYLSRLKRDMKIYLSNKSEAKAINLAEYIDKHYRALNVIDIQVFLGEKKFSCRMVCYRLPAGVANEAKRKALIAVKRKKRKELSKKQLDLLEFNIYVTNVSRKMWPSEIIGTIYRVRWQIELTFKQWKQLFEIDVMKGTVPERIKCLLYSRLTMILLATSIYSWSNWYSLKFMSREVSPFKLIQWLGRKGRLGQAILSNKVEDLVENLLNDLPKGLWKQKRKRKTTLELLREETFYLESFA